MGNIFQSHLVTSATGDLEGGGGLLPQLVGLPLALTELGGGEDELPGGEQGGVRHGQEQGQQEAEVQHHQVQGVQGAHTLQLLAS